MGLNYPYGDISYWVALVFTLGCVVWVINRWYGLFPSQSKHSLLVEDWSGLVGGTLFEIGSILFYWEALNPEAEIHLGRYLTRREGSGPHTSPGGAWLQGVTGKRLDGAGGLQRYQSRDLVVVKDRAAGPPRPGKEVDEKSCTTELGVDHHVNDGGIGMSPYEGSGSLVLVSVANLRPRAVAQAQATLSATGRKRQQGVEVCIGTQQGDPVKLDSMSGPPRHQPTAHRSGRGSEPGGHVHSSPGLRY